MSLTKLIFEVVKIASLEFKWSSTGYIRLDSILKVNFLRPEACLDLLSSELAETLVGLLSLAEDFSCTLRIEACEEVIGGKFKGHS